MKNMTKLDEVIDRSKARLARELVIAVCFLLGCGTLIVAALREIR